MFHAPTTISMSGTTGSGNTSLLFRILEYKDSIFTIPPEKVLYCYGAWQSLFEAKEKDIDFHLGLPTEDEVNNFADGEHNLIILDDLMDSALDSEHIQSLFTRGSHHKRLTLIILNQNLYHKGKCAVTINRNCHYLILLKNLRDVSQLGVLARQSGLGKSLMEAYWDCMTESYGYLLLNFSPHGDDDYRMKTHIFPGEDTIVYIPI